MGGHPLNYDQWFIEFTRGKTEVTPSEPSSVLAVKCVRRFIDSGSGQIWEIAITYTDRLVTRSGPISGDGVTIKWGNWNTHHEIEIERVS